MCLESIYTTLGREVRCLEEARRANVSKYQEYMSLSIICDMYLA